MTRGFRGIRDSGDSFPHLRIQRFLERGVVEFTTALELATSGSSEEIVESRPVDGRRTSQQRSWTRGANRGFKASEKLA